MRHLIDIPDAEWRRRIEGRNRMVSLGETQAYRVDEGLFQKFLSRYEPPSVDEVDRIYHE